jgi:uncharacterized linocin/CFP29 family protein
MRCPNPRGRPHSQSFDSGISRPSKLSGRNASSSASDPRPAAVIFHGFEGGDITGIIEASPHKPIAVNGILDWPKAIVAGLEVLRAAGVNGPYALVLGRQAYDELDADSEDGYPLRRRLAETLTDVELIWAPALQGGAVLLSKRGGDYELTVGQDLSIGYAAHDRTDVELYLTESFTFRVLEEKAAVFLKRGGAKAKAK